MRRRRRQVTRAHIATPRTFKTPTHVNAHDNEDALGKETNRKHIHNSENTEEQHREEFQSRQKDAIAANRAQ